MVSQTVKNLSAMRRPGFDPWAGKIPWKEMATHSNILAWRVPWTEEPGGLKSIGSQGSPSRNVPPSPRALITQTPPYWATLLIKVSSRFYLPNYLYFQETEAPGCTTRWSPRTPQFSGEEHALELKPLDPHASRLTPRGGWAWPRVPELPKMPDLSPQDH